MFAKIKEFISDVRKIVGEITWPKRDTLIQLTIMVIFVSITAGIILGAADFLFTKLISLITLK